MVTGNHSDKKGMKLGKLDCMKVSGEGNFMLEDSCIGSLSLLNLAGITELCALALRLVRRSVFAKEVFK